MGYVQLAALVAEPALTSAFLGDAPVRLAEVYMFLNVAEEVHYMCEVPYAHKDQPFDDCQCVPLID
jgi:hypothetical protein